MRKLYSEGAQICFQLRAYNLLLGYHRYGAVGHLLIHSNGCFAKLRRLLTMHWGAVCVKASCFFLKGGIQLSARWRDSGDLRTDFQEPGWMDGWMDHKKHSPFCLNPRIMIVSGQKTGHAIWARRTACSLVHHKNIRQSWVFWEIMYAEEGAQSLFPSVLSCPLTQHEEQVDKRCFWLASHVSGEAH